MSVSLMMGLGFLAALVVLVLVLAGLVAFSGRTAKRSKGRHSSANVAAAPTNVFLRGPAEPVTVVPVAVPVVAGYQPAQSSGYRPAPLAPELGGDPGTGRWYPGMGAARLPEVND